MSGVKEDVDKPFVELSVASLPDTRSMLAKARDRVRFVFHSPFHNAIFPNIVPFLGNPSQTWRL